MDGALRQFLKDRGVSTTVIRKMEEEKVDRYVIQAASDETLSHYLSHAGDRLAVQAFCSSKDLTQESKKTSKKTQILAKLRRKLLLKRENPASNNDSDDSDERQKVEIDKDSRHASLEGNKNALRDKRKIELGWLHHGENGYMQVRKKKGGGTRKIDVSKGAKQRDILEVAKSLFFNNELSTFGDMDEFIFDLTDFCETSMSGSEETVGEMYKRTGLSILRFYMATKYKTPTPPKKPNVVGTSHPERDIFVEIPDDDSLPDVSPLEDNNTPISPTLDLSQTDIFFNFNVEHSVPSSISTLEDHSYSTPSMHLDEINLINDEDLINIQSADNHSIEENQIVPQAIVPNIQPPSPRETVELIIHRGSQGFLELLGYFKDANMARKCLTIVRVLGNGEREIGEDTGGVLRDLFSEFWKEFYDKCTLGTVVKVPCLRHDFGSEEWKSTARILCYGWENVGYWPVELSKAFILQVLEKDAVNPDLLLADFKHFISAPDRDVFEKTLADVNDVNNDDLLDLLETHECKTMVNVDNVKAIFIEIAHKALIQTPMFVCDCWQDILRGSGITTAQLNHIYSSLFPTNKGILKLLQFPENLSTQALDTIKHFKRYVKELDEKRLRLFLRFCTGSDLVTVPKISVTFTDLKGLCRRPVSHTCACVLEFPQTYENFMEFRSEFDNILESNVWIMDYV